MSSRFYANEEYYKALRFAAIAHRHQIRRGSGDPYIIHPLAVARIVEEAGFKDATVVAALLHDVAEDTTITLNEIGMRFNGASWAIVRACTEIKVDPDGQPIPWEDRKGEHIQRLRRGATIEVRAVVLADKLDNLRSIRADLEAGQAVWDLFHAPRERFLWYYETIIETCGRGDGRIHNLADDCRRELTRVRAFPSEKMDLEG